MTPELIPCPFCGHAARLFHASAEAAIIRWNSRKMAYAHRNGETEAPTAPGKYWFDGSAILWTGEIKLRQALDAIGHDSRILVWEERSLEHLPVAQFSGQWWGPIVAPWEQGA